MHVPSIAGINPNFLGMVEVVACSRAKAFAGTLDSTFTGYILRFIDELEVYWFELSLSVGCVDSTDLENRASIIRTTQLWHCKIIVPGLGGTESG